MKTESEEWLIMGMSSNYVKTLIMGKIVYFSCICHVSRDCSSCTVICSVWTWLSSIPSPQTNLTPKSELKTWQTNKLILLYIYNKNIMYYFFMNVFSFYNIYKNHQYNNNVSSRHSTKKKTINVYKQYHIILI